VIRRLLFLFAGCAAFWLLTALPARMLGGGDAAVAYAGTAMLLCFVPAALALAWASWAMTQDSQQQLLVVVGGGGVRMFFVLLAGLLLTQYVPFFQERFAVFLCWLLAAYLFTLALEIALILASRSRSSSGVESKGVEAKESALDEPALKR
jgi:hypothetical protein